MAKSIKFSTVRIPSLQHKLQSKFPGSIDLTSDNDLDLLDRAVDFLTENANNAECLKILEKTLLDENPKGIFPLLAIKIAKSRFYVNAIEEPLKVSMVFAMYKEHNRIRPRSEHPNGENFLIRKVRQMEALFKQKPAIEWQLIAVDDGCPEHSGEIAQQIVEQNGLQECVKVLFLADAIKQNLEVVSPMKSTAESQKGGSVVYGMWYAAQDQFAGRHIIGYTDADLSTHLGQLGLLLDPLFNMHKIVAAGSRRAKGAVVIKQGKRNDRGKLFIYLWKRMVSALPHITDTQCGFKVFDGSVVEKIISDMIEKRFAFDIELLIKSTLIRKDPIAIVPIGWIDSEALSTTTDLQPYLPMLQSIANVYRKYLPPDEEADRFADFVLSLTDDDFAKLLDNIPEAITSRNPYEFARFNGVTVDELKAAIGH